MNLKTPRIVLVIFSLALILRLCLALTNRDANDNHVDVVSWIVDKKTIPERADCWSCYQPKAYYVICAGVVKLFAIHSYSRRILCMQLVNFIISFFILLLFWKFIEKKRYSNQHKIILFALFAFNSTLIGINSQGTNDTLAIFAGIAFSFFLDDYLARQNQKSFLLAVLFVILACLSKASGLLLTVLFVIIIALRFIQPSPKNAKFKLAKLTVIFVICYFLIVPLWGSYYTNYTKYKSLALSSWNKDSPPKFFETSYVGRPGVINISQGFFTFRYVDMIKHPYINNESENFPLHRTSLWSQLYGRTFFMHFDQWPGSWQTQNKFIITTGSVLLILGIVPLILFLTGIFLSLKNFLKSFFEKRRFLIPDFHLLAVAGFFSASVKYSYDYRDFASMKSIYIFPALLSFLKFTGDGWQKLSTLKAIDRFIKTVLVIIVCCSITDVCYLIFQQIKFHHYF